MEQVDLTKHLDISDVLDECLDRMANGESIESCAARHPGAAGGARTAAEDGGNDGERCHCSFLRSGGEAAGAPEADGGGGQEEICQERGVLVAQVEARPGPLACPRRC